MFIFQQPASNFFFKSISLAIVARLRLLYSKSVRYFDQRDQWYLETLGVFRSLNTLGP